MEVSSAAVTQAPEIYVLIGVPGSGKSTWVEHFMKYRETPFTLVSSDAVLDRIATESGKTYSDVHREFIDQATVEAKATFRDAVAEGNSIIFDQTNLSQKKRRGILSQLPNGYTKVAVVFQIERSEVERRIKARARQTGKNIPYSVLEDMYNRFGYPTLEEGFDRIIEA